MNAAIDFDKIGGFLKEFDHIVFALVFGSAATGKSNKLSDVDIGIYTTEELPLLKLGKMVVGLEKITKTKIDLLVLNDLFKRKPYFAYQVVASAKLLFTKNQETFVDFKRNVFLYYLDTKPLIDMMNKSLDKRLRTDAFGERNYA